MKRSVLLLTSLMFLGSCAYTLDGGNQDITVLTPGAENAICFVYVHNIKYKIRPPTTTNVIKAKENMVVDCMAPGNRRRKVVIEPQLENSAVWNITNGIFIGGAWDYYSRSVFKFPEIIEVDFTNMQARPQKLPAHNAPDVRQPEEHTLEEFLPGNPRMNSDKYKQEIELQRREKNTEGDLSPGFSSDDDAYMTGDQTGAPYGKSNLESMKDMPSSVDMNPANDAPTPVQNEQPLYPVE